MERRNGEVWERKTMINELMQGYELAKQLQGQHCSSSEAEFLTQRIISSFSRAINFLKSRSSEAETQQTDSPHSVSGSPSSEISNRTPFLHPERGNISKKRKAEIKWTEQIQVSVGSIVEGPPDDGKSWRKYGQKQILGAKYPRAYYRCTHKYVQGCVAKKQVQRSEADPTIFNVMYQGSHTCVQSAHPMAMVSPSPEMQEEEYCHTDQPTPLQQHQQKQLISFQTGLKVKTEDLQLEQDLNHSSFSFLNAFNCGNSEDGGGGIFSSPSPMENTFIGSFSPSFISPATSESNYFPVSPCNRMSSYAGAGPSIPTPESDINEIMSAVTTLSNSSLGDLDFPIDDFFLS